MSKKLNDEEKEKLIQELTKSNLDLGLDILGPTKEVRKSLKTPIEKLMSYTLLVESSVFWASRQAYLEMVRSFLLKEINGETFTTQFLRLRGENMISKKELCATIEDQISPIPDLYYTFQATNFMSVIDDLFWAIDLYDPEIDDDDSNIDDIVYGEITLRSVIQEKFVPKLQQSCDLNPSFFQL